MLNSGLFKDYGPNNNILYNKKEYKEVKLNYKDIKLPSIKSNNFIKEEKEFSKSDQLYKCLFYYYCFDRQIQRINEDLYSYEIDLYLIDKKWFSDFKDYCNYEEIKKLLFNLTYNINHLSEFHFKKYIDELKKIEINTEKLKLPPKAPMKKIFDNYFYYIKYDFVNKKTMDIIFQEFKVSNRAEFPLFKVTLFKHNIFQVRYEKKECEILKLNGNMVKEKFLIVVYNEEYIETKIYSSFISYDYEEVFKKFEINNKNQKQQDIYYNGAKIGIMINILLVMNKKRSNKNMFREENNKNKGNKESKENKKNNVFIKQDDVHIFKKNISTINLKDFMRSEKKIKINNLNDSRAFSILDKPKKIRIIKSAGSKNDYNNFNIIKIRECPINNKLVKIENKDNENLKSENLKKENEKLIKENDFLKKENAKLKKKLNELGLIKDDKIKNLNLLLVEKMKIIEDLKSKLNSNSYNGLSNGEKLIIVNFNSVDQHINHCIICTNKTKFFDVESDLYKKYPKCSENENLFMFGDLEIDRWKTLEENNIDGYTIMLKRKDNNE